jgi:hypothetical protein
LTGVIKGPDVEGGHCHRDVDELLRSFIFDRVDRVRRDIEEIPCLYVGGLSPDLYAAATADNDVGLFRRMMVRLLSGPRLDLDPRNRKVIGRGVACLQEYVRNEARANSREGL